MLQEVRVIRVNMTSYSSLRLCFMQNFITVRIKHKGESASWKVLLSFVFPPYDVQKQAVQPRLFRFLQRTAVFLSAHLEVWDWVWKQVIIRNPHADICFGQVNNLQKTLARRRRLHHGFLEDKQTLSPFLMIIRK